MNTTMQKVVPENLKMGDEIILFYPDTERQQASTLHNKRCFYEKAESVYLWVYFPHIAEKMQFRFDLFIYPPASSEPVVGKPVLVELEALRLFLKDLDSFTPKTEIMNYFSKPENQYHLPESERPIFEVGDTVETRTMKGTEKLNKIQYSNEHFMKNTMGGKIEKIDSDGTYYVHGLPWPVECISLILKGEKSSFDPTASTGNPKWTAIDCEEKEENWEIKIGEVFNLNDNTVAAKQVLRINESQKHIIEMFAIIQPNADMNRTYTLNGIKFTMFPRLFVD